MSQESSPPAGFLDLTGVPCPANASRALLRLELLDAGDLLELLVDDGEPRINVPAALEAEGHAVVAREQTTTGTWRLLVKRG
jgi:TusA-related sulfurtransferase